MSQEDLAAKLGVTRQTISKWEKNEVQPAPDNLLTICDLFEINPQHFRQEVASTKVRSIGKWEMIGYCAGIAISTLASVFLIALTVTLGLMSHTANTGDLTVANYTVHPVYLTISAVCTGVVIGVVILLCVLFAKKLRK